MSERDARCPSFVTCVFSLTLSASVSSLLERSNFSTLPVTWLLLIDPDADADAPPEVLSDDIEPVDELVEPLVSEPVVLPVAPGDVDESRDVVLPVLSLSLCPEADDPLLPVPDDPLLPLVCAHEGAATSSPAVARPATLPHPIFMLLPLQLLRLETDQAPCHGSSCWLPYGSDALRMRQEGVSDWLAT